MVAYVSNSLLLGVIYGLKFRILPKVDGFRLKGVLHKPGDVVDLPESYEGESWLERVDAPVVYEVPLARLEKIVPVECVPFEPRAPAPPKKLRQKKERIKLSGS